MIEYGGGGASGRLENEVVGSAVIHSGRAGRFGVSADRAFSTGFLFFVVTIALAVPGVAIILREGVRRR